MTGTYRFKTRFYCILDLTGELQKAIGFTLKDLSPTFDLIHDIIIFSTEKRKSEFKTILCFIIYCFFQNRN